MSIQNAQEYLNKFGKDKDIIIFDKSSATVELAAIALGCKPSHIAKTLSFLVGEQVVLIVMAGDTKIDNAKYKTYFGKKATMLPPSDVETLVGHAVGGVCPFGIKEGVKVFLDISLKRFDKVYPACGGSNTAIGLNIEELEIMSNFEEWIDVGKLYENM